MPTQINQALAGTAGVPPASSNVCIQGTIESSYPDDVAFHESGRGARGPSEELEW